MVSHRPKIIEVAHPNSSPKTLQLPTVISAISHYPLHILLYIMNTIIIHPRNRQKVSAAHDIAADLVSRGYRKLTPWWVDGFEQEGLLPLDEVDESAEEVEEMLPEEKEEVDVFQDVDLLGGGKFIYQLGTRVWI